MAKIIVRFTICSELENSISLLEKNLISPPDVRKQKGEERILINGGNSGRRYSRTEFIYVYEFLDISDVEICNNAFIKEWEKEKKALKKVIGHGFNLELNYEVTIYNNNYPSLYFLPDFLNLLSNLKIEFSLYFYND